MLLENETLRLKQLDEQHNQQLKDWREHLKPRKRVGFLTRFIEQLKIPACLAIEMIWTLDYFSIYEPLFTFTFYLCFTVASHSQLKFILSN